jgi:hypothetical protein
VSRRCPGVGRWLLGLVVALLLAPGAAAQDMPDPSQIHGRALPQADLPDGTVTVRVAREAMGNYLSGQDVRITVGGATRIARTDGEGRAEFRGLTPGAEGRAEVTVDGEALTSQPFVVPGAGGLRVMLFAGLERAAQRKAQEESDALSAPAVKGAVVIGGDSRIIMEFSNDTLFAFYVLDIVNNARTRVDTGGPLVIDLPTGISGAAIREGSSPTASVDGSRVTIQGPFAPGTTQVQLQFALRFSTAERIFEQSFPVPVQRVVLAVEKVTAQLGMASPQFTAVREVTSEDGLYLLAEGPALAAGTPLVVTLSNLPAHSRAPRFIALGVALAVVALGIWLGMTGRPAPGREREAMIARRDALLGQLAQLEARRRDGGIGGDRYAARRQRLLSELEEIYGELDEASSGPRGGGEGVAA